MPIDQDTLRTVMGRFSTGVAVVTTMLDGQPLAMTANAIASVSLDPPLILFCPVRTSKTLAAIQVTQHFAVNVLHEDQEDVARRFAASGKKSFDGIETHPGATGAPLLKDCVAWLDCRLHATYEGGDHRILVGLVESAEVISDRPPLIFYRSNYGSLAP